MRVSFDEIEHEEYTDARYQGQPFTGTAFAARDGVMCEECDFVAGQMDGMRREFFRDGSPKWFAHYRGGQAHGPDHSFFADGRPQRSAVYDPGVLLHEVEYGENGQKVSEYDAASGVRTEWRLDGSVRKVTVYEPGDETLLSRAAGGALLRRGRATDGRAYADGLVCRPFGRCHLTRHCSGPGGRRVLVIRKRVRRPTGRRTSARYAAREAVWNSAITHQHT